MYCARPIDRMVGDIHVAVRGVGRPVLLIHGNSGDLHFFDGIVPLLAATRRVIAMDCRGQGRSVRGRGELSIARMAEDAADVIRSLVTAGVAVDVVGFSDGANVAMLLASRHPELVRSLVLNSGNFAVDGLRRGVRGMLRLAERALTVSGAVSRRERIRLMLDEPGIRPAALNAIHVPTLVLAGSRDIIRRTHTAAIAQLIPNARYHTIGGTHEVMRTRPDVTGRIIASFLRGVDAAQESGGSRESA
jgi:pimeloyl-ACP methyl ester carboxylesterase